jgi:uncharacterized damage-inducible protein DinB
MILWRRRTRAVDGARQAGRTFLQSSNHHRGQAHAVITAAGEQIGDTDIFLIV